MKGRDKRERQVQGRVGDHVAQFVEVAAQARLLAEFARQHAVHRIERHAQEQPRRQRQEQRRHGRKMEDEAERDRNDAGERRDGIGGDTDPRQESHAGSQQRLERGLQRIDAGHEEWVEVCANLYRRYRLRKRNARTNGFFTESESSANENRTGWTTSARCAGVRAQAERLARQERSARDTRPGFGRTGRGARRDASDQRSPALIFASTPAPGQSFSAPRRLNAVSLVLR